MELLVQLNNRRMIQQLANRHVDLVVGLADYCSRALVQMSVDELINLDYPHHVYILVNRLYDQVDIEGLKKALIQLNDANIKGLIFQDFAVMSIAQTYQLKFDLIYNSDTLNTSHGSINTIASLGASGCFLANQLHADEVQSIFEHAKVDLYVQIHGVQYISHSKRKLLSNYFEFNQIEHDTKYEANIQMKVSDSEHISHIYEDDFGTHIFTQNELCLKDYIDLYHIQYGYIETLYLEDDYILKLIDFYRSERSYQDLINQYPTHHYDTGFLEDGTVYKLEDVRKREANEKR